MNHMIKNPIIPGFYPDPSVCRVGEDYYLVCSSFELINPEKVGCMVGEVIGLYASGNGEESNNSAVFRWSEYEDL